MLTFRKAREKDREAVWKLLEEDDLLYPGIEFSDFYIALNNDLVVGIARLQEFPTFRFLSSLGVSSAYRHQGIASQLINHLCKVNSKPIYLYTVIPDFFLRLGFSRTFGRPDLPPRELFNCTACTPERCVCMVKS